MVWVGCDERENAKERRWGRILPKPKVSVRRSVHGMVPFIIMVDDDKMLPIQRDVLTVTTRNSGIYNIPVIIDDDDDRCSHDASV